MAMNITALTTAQTTPAHPAQGAEDATGPGLIDFASLLQSHLSTDTAPPRAQGRGHGSPSDASSAADAKDTPDDILSPAQLNALLTQQEVLKPAHAPSLAPDGSPMDPEEDLQQLPDTEEWADPAMAGTAADAPSSSRAEPTALVPAETERPNRVATGLQPKRGHMEAVNVAAKSARAPINAALEVATQKAPPLNTAPNAAGAASGPLSSPAPETNLGAGLWNPAADAHSANDAPSSQPSGLEALSGAAGLTAPRPTGPLAGTATAAPLAQAHIDTPTHDPQFSGALAARISMLAKDGIQKATLRLHPAEMGPVQVQIVVEGGRAIVNFSAAQSATCDLLQSSMSDLADAMGEAGLDFGGGDVSQQAQPDEAVAPPSMATDPDRTNPDDHPEEQTVMREQAPRGMLDLFA